MSANIEEIKEIATQTPSRQSQERRHLNSLILPPTEEWSLNNSFSSFAVNKSESSTGLPRLPSAQPTLAQLFYCNWIIFWNYYQQCRSVYSYFRKLNYCTIVGISTANREFCCCSVGCNNLHLTCSQNQVCASLIRNENREQCAPFINSISFSIAL